MDFQKTWPTPITGWHATNRIRGVKVQGPSVARKVRPNLQHKAPMSRLKKVESGVFGKKGGGCHERAPWGCRRADQRRSPPQGIQKEGKRGKMLPHLRGKRGTARGKPKEKLRAEKPSESWGRGRRGDAQKVQNNLEKKSRWAP